MARWSLLFLLVSSLLFLLVSSLPMVAPGLDPRRHTPHPWVYAFGEVTEWGYKPTLEEPWIAVDPHSLIKTLATTPGFMLASAALEKRNFVTFILVDEIYTNGTKLLIPNCDAITIFLRPLENETQILQNNPGIIDSIRSGERYVKKRLFKKATRFNGAGNVSVSHPFIYPHEERGVVVHGADGGFGALETQINNLSLYGPEEYMDDVGFPKGLRFGGANRFESLEFPLTKEEEDIINKSEIKIEMAMVASIVPTPTVYAPDSVNWFVLTQMCGGPEKAAQQLERENEPYTITMLYSLHF